MEQLEKLRNDVLEAVEHTLRQAPQPVYQDSGADGTFMDVASQLQILQEIRDSLGGLLQGRAGPSPEIRILKQLHFESIHRRIDDMAPAEVHTFEWILAGSPVGHPADREASKREAAASRFRHWLREENGVFHISGKPGSGKSTMMKFLLSDERTKQELEKWAGPKQLVFAHFFFWLSGEKLQYSLEGLHRSILFETLIQCPELIPDVFPRAYRSFSKTKAEESIDELFFRPNDLEKAFTDLITISPNPGYRVCLFIDGLDEYGGDDLDGLEHQQLADALNSWAAHRDVKILTSSRPHRQFEGTFSDERRIRLHELTRSDVVLAGRQMFEKDKSFERPEVQACYVNLVNRVADASDGVFLWATLAIRSLLNSIGRYDPIDSLGQHLDGIPKNFNKLYEKMFMSIDPVDQARAFKLLLLAAEVPRDIGRLNALSVTWLRDLEDVDFPMKCGFQPYTDEEIRWRHLEAKYQVDGLTKGLLEIVDASQGPLFSRKFVQFFHRTVRDFVRQSSVLRGFAAQVPNLTTMPTYARLVLAELHFVRTGHIQSGVRYSGIVFNPWKENGPLFDGLLEAYARAMEHHNSQSSGKLPPFPGSTIALRFPIAGMGSTDGLRSFLHFFAYRNFVGYIQRKVAADPGLLRPQGPMSLLLSAAVPVNNPNAPAMVKALLDAGASPHDLVSTYTGTSQFTIWQLACTACVCMMINADGGGGVRRNCQIIQYFLEAGADANCFVLLGRRRKENCQAESRLKLGNRGAVNSRGARGSPVRSRPTHAISLLTLLRQLDPPNLGELLKSIKEPNPSQDIQSNHDSFVSVRLEVREREQNAQFILMTSLNS
jgi:hypothetical protein